MPSAYSSASRGRATFHKGLPGSMPQARTNPMNESRTCSLTAGAMRALVNHHCSSRARARSKPSLIGASIKVLTKLARNDNCRSSSRSKRRPRRLARSRRNSPSIAPLSKVINSIPGRTAAISLASSLPMTQVNRVCGHAACKARRAAAAWQASPMADRRNRQTCCGGDLKSRVIVISQTGKKGRRIATATGAMLSDPACLGNMPPDAAESIFDPQFWRARGELSAVSAGRGSAWFIASGNGQQSGGRQWVLRHYRRGGFIARLSRDGYVWAGEERVRAFAEWRLLDLLRQRGLPVPKPVAARYQREGLWYRCDLITERIVDAEPLSSVLARGALVEP